MATIKIEYLADHKDVIPTLAGWTYEEWSYLHPERTLSEVERLISQGSNKDHMPVSLVAIDRGKVVGMVALQASDFKARPDLSPWLAGLYVDKQHRRKGVGKRLVREIEKLAARQGAGKLYLVTDDAENYYSKLGWSAHEHAVSRGIAVTVMEKDLACLSWNGGEKILK